MHSLQIIECRRFCLTELPINMTNVTGSAKMGLVADSNGTYLKTCNLTYKFGATLKIGPNIVLTQHYCLV